MTKTNYLSIILSSIVILMCSASIVVGGGCDKYYYYYNVTLILWSLINILNNFLTRDNK